MTLKRKIKALVWGNLVQFAFGKKIYPFFYVTYWHYLLNSRKLNINNTCYYSAIPNPGAGIGHQLANWIAGYWYAKQFSLKFAHIPFSEEKWETFFGFGKNEIQIKELKKKGFKTRKLPLFHWNNQVEVELNRSIINSYEGQKIVFIAEQDQFYKEQFGVIDEIKHKFHTAKARANDHLIFRKEHFNIAIHLRRGDISIGQQIMNSNLISRWQDNSYFKNVLDNVLINLETNKPVFVYLFSQGSKADFTEFKMVENIHFCLDMNAQDSFLHMVFADLLITSKSSFSYKPALLSNGIKICPKDFWHGYPSTYDWILADEDGAFNENYLNLLHG